MSPSPIFFSIPSWLKLKVRCSAGPDAWIRVRLCRRDSLCGASWAFLRSCRDSRQTARVAVGSAACVGIFSETAAGSRGWDTSADAGRGEPRAARTGGEARGAARMRNEEGNYE